MNKKLEQIKYSFRFIDGEPELESYGQFTGGLSSKEIERYIQVRANKLRVKSLINKFNKIAGCNTATSFYCDNCEKRTILMYRHDVKRFADVLFGVTKGTYFD